MGDSETATERNSLPGGQNVYNLVTSVWYRDSISFFIVSVPNELNQLYSLSIGVELFFSGVTIETLMTTIISKCRPLTTDIGIRNRMTS